MDYCIMDGLKVFSSFLKQEPTETQETFGKTAQKRLIQSKSS